MISNQNVSKVGQFGNPAIANLKRQVFDGDDD
jgi:hypothetical protein